MPGRPLCVCVCVCVWRFFVYAFHALQPLHSLHSLHSLHALHSMTFLAFIALIAFTTFITVIILHSLHSLDMLQYACAHHMTLHILDAAGTQARPSYAYKTKTKPQKLTTLHRYRCTTLLPTCPLRGNAACRSPLG